MNPSPKLFADIETIGTEDPEVIEEIAAGIKPPANYTKPDTIAGWELASKPALLTEAIKKTSFDGALGKVICLGYALDDGPVQSIMAESERQLLLSVANVLPRNVPHVQLVGHNVGWDARFLWQRFIVNALLPPDWLRLAVKAKPWDTEDTMLLWNPDRDKRISLDRLCKVLHIESPKGEMDGSKVWAAYSAGEFDKIAHYCRDDVSAMRQCYYRLTA